MTLTFDGFTNFKTKSFDFMLHYSSYFLFFMLPYRKAKRIGKGKEEKELKHNGA